jgi:thiol-disulfide isomerase/thioredoxin
MSTVSTPHAAPLKSREGEGSEAAVRVDLFGRRGCHLCDEAKAALLRIAAELPLALQVSEIDVDTDFALRERYGLLVPVVLIEGERASELRLDEAAVRARLQAVVAARAGAPKRRSST